MPATPQKSGNNSATRRSVKIPRKFPGRRPWAIPDDRVIWDGETPDWLDAANDVLAIQHAIEHGRLGGDL